MSVTVEVDGREYLNGLNLNQKKLLIQTLKEELEEEFDKPVEGRIETNIDADIEVNVTDLLWGMSSWDKKDIYEDIKEDFEEECDCADSAEELFAMEAITYTDRELGSALSEIWQSRNFITPNQLQRLQAITKESFI
jgi:hypothetical protein